MVQIDMVEMWLKSTCTDSAQTVQASVWMQNTANREIWERTPTKPNAEEHIRNMNQSLFALLSHFAKKRDAIITMAIPGEVKWRKIGKWLKSAQFTHRVYIQVKPKTCKERRI